MAASIIIKYISASAIVLVLIACLAQALQAPSILMQTASMRPSELKAALPSLLAALPEGTSVSVQRDRTALKALLDVSEFSPSKCSGQFVFNKLTPLINLYVVKQKSVADFLEYLKKTHFSQCERVLENKVNKFEDGLGEFAEKLRESFVISIDSDTELAPLAERDEGIKKYISTQFVPVEEFVNDANSSGRKQLQRYIRDMQHSCESISEELNPLIDLYGAAEHDSQLKPLINQNIRQWMITTEICSSIQGNAKDIAKEIYQSLN